MLDPAPTDLNGDAAAGMLKKVGAFIEPLTRFRQDPTSIALLRHDFHAGHRDAVGQRPVRDEGSGWRRSAARRRAQGRRSRSTQSELAAMLERASRGPPIACSPGLSAHGADPEAVLTVGDIYSDEGAVGYVSTCKTCHGSGQIDCLTCRAKGKVTCVRCGGAKTTSCSRCNGSSQAPCSGLRWRGGQTKQVEHRGLNPATNELVIRYEQVWECLSALRWAKDRTLQILQRGPHHLLALQRRRHDRLQACHGAGHTTCSACTGEGELHRSATIQCDIGLRSPSGQTAK